MRGGVKMNIDLKTVNQVTVVHERYDDVAFRVSIKQGDKEIAFRAGKLLLDGTEPEIAVPLARGRDKKPIRDKKLPPSTIASLPAKPIDHARWTPTSKAPAAVHKEKRMLSIELPAKYATYTFGGGGRYIVFRFDSLNMIGIMDVESGKIVREIPGISPGDLIAANATHLFIVMPGKMLIQSWSFKKLQRDRMVRIDVGNTPKSAITPVQRGRGPCYCSVARLSYWTPIRSNPSRSRAASSAATTATVIRFAFRPTDWFLVGFPPATARFRIA